MSALTLPCTRHVSSTCPSDQTARSIRSSHSALEGLQALQVKQVRIELIITWIVADGTYVATFSIFLDIVLVIDEIFK